MRSTRVTAALLACALLPGFFPRPASADSQTPASPLSLADAVALALQHDPDYRLTHAGVDAARAQLRAAGGPRLPAVDIRDALLYASPVAELSTPFGSLPFSTTTTTNVPQLEVRYDLFDGGRTAARVSHAAADLAAGEGQERNARMALVDRTTTAYFDLVAAQQSAAVADRALGVAQSHLLDARRLYDAGQVPHADVLRAETEVANERVQAIGAHDAAALAQTSLDDAIGTSLGDLHEPTDSLDAPAPDVALQTLLAAAQAGRGDLAAAQAAVDAARSAVKEAQAATAPAVGVDVADGNVQPAVAPGYRNQFSVGLNVVWTLFDGGATAGRIDAARAGVDEAGLRLEQLRRSVELEVRRAYLALLDARARADAAHAYVTLADENVRLAQVRYRGGVGTLLELQDAELRATTARRELIAAQVAVREGVVHVRLAAGLL